MQHEEKHTDPVLELCETLGNSSQQSLDVLNDLMLSIGGRTTRQLLSLSDLGCLLTDALNSKDAALVELIQLALKIRQSAAAGHPTVEFVGRGRNPASLRHTDCLLVRFADRVFSYKPVHRDTPMDRWASRLDLILGAPNGVAAFNHLVVTRALVKVGPVWNISTDMPSFSDLRHVHVKAAAGGTLAVETTDLCIDREEGVGSATVDYVSLSDLGVTYVALDGPALLEAIATGAIELGSR